MSAIIEADAHGSFVGSSYMYASARDWARYGLHSWLKTASGRDRNFCRAGLRRHDGLAGRSLGWRIWSWAGAWLWGSDAITPGKNPDISFGLPADTFWMKGHDGQYTAVIPSRRLVVVRLGLTPSRDHYQPQPLVKAVLDALQ